MTRFTRPIHAETALATVATIKTSIHQPRRIALQQLLRTFMSHTPPNFDAIETIIFDRAAHASHNGLRRHQA
jgi:hypothetical protein